MGRFLLRVIISSYSNKVNKIFSQFPTPNSLLPTPYSLLPTPYSLLPTPYSLLPKIPNPRYHKKFTLILDSVFVESWLEAIHAPIASFLIFRLIFSKLIPPSNQIRKFFLDE
ncbi:MAG: hypothetical protein F6K26_54400 [Moorea sp. SIO2I5]|nr:hypothetical protein [Moorena sp. SIO2I5]